MKDKESKTKQPLPAQPQKSNQNIYYEMKKEIENMKPSTYSDSSSSTTTTESSDIFSLQDEEHTGLENVLGTFLNDSSEDSAEEESCHDDFIRKTLPTQDLSFFENLSEIPDIERISEDVSIATLVLIEHKFDNRSDLGKFVDPLTGLEVHLNKSPISEIKGPAVVTVNDKDEQSETYPSDSSELMDPDMAETRRSFYEKEDEKDLFETFLEIDAEKSIQPAVEVDWETLLKEQEEKRLRDTTIELINDLIHKVVELTEYMSPEMLLRLNLDKYKLLVDISKRYEHYQLARKISEFLNRKMVDFYRRRKQFRYITPDNSKNEQDRQLKYIEVLKSLDMVLAKERDLKLSTACVTKELRHEFRELVLKVQNNVNRFDGEVKKHLCKESRPQLNAIIDSLLQRMTKYRNELSEVRFDMITRQHSQAFLLEKLSKIEELGNGLTLRDYDQIQNENTALGKKIEERNSDLQKLHFRSHTYLHLWAHYKEKICMLGNLNITKRFALKQLHEKRSNLRKLVYRRKLKRSCLRKEVHELSTQCGLLDKPLLMYDYDQIVQQLEEKHAEVSGLRMTLAAIQQKINKLEKRHTPLPQLY